MLDLIDEVTVIQFVDVVVLVAFFQPSSRLLFDFEFRQVAGFLLCWKSVISEPALVESPSRLVHFPRKLVLLILDADDGCVVAEDLVITAHFYSVLSVLLAHDFAEGDSFDERRLLGCFDEVFSCEGLLLHLPVSIFVLEEEFQA